MIIDTHAHLVKRPDLGNALRRADEAGVHQIIAMSMDVKSCQKNLEIKKNVDRPQIYVSFGMHPSEVNLDELEKVIELMMTHQKELHAIGEIGLDFWYKWVRKDEEKKNEQREAFRKQLAISKILDLPVVIHSRGAWKECLQSVKEAGIKRANFHWYSGPVDVLKEIMAAGHFVSASPSIAYSPQSREAIAAADIKQILIETDCPVFYGQKDDPDGFSAEPKDVYKTLKAYCLLTKTDEDKALHQFNENAKLFFNLA